MGDPQGEYELRAAIRDYLHSARGVSCRPEQILVGAGSEYLLMLLSQLLGRDGNCPGKSNLSSGLPGTKEPGTSSCSRKMDRYGMDVLDLEQSKTQAAYVMPSHQYPTGIVMPVKRRQELLSWAYRGENRYVIEDDYDSEFRYKGRPIPALQGMDQGKGHLYGDIFTFHCPGDPRGIYGASWRAPFKVSEPGRILCLYGFTDRSEGAVSFYYRRVL